MSTNFTIYSETDTIKIKHQKYTGTSDYELIKSHKELWKMINNNKLLPVMTGAQDRTRSSQENMIGIYTPPLLGQVNTLRDMPKRLRSAKIMRSSCKSCIPSGKELVQRQERLSCIR